MKNRILTSCLMMGMFGIQIGLTQTFEVASVKANRSSEGSSRLGCGADSSLGIPPGKCEVRNASLLRIIGLAYDLPFFNEDQHVSGGPGWVRSERYDIEAKAENASGSDADLRRMLRSLLAERFKLKLHEQTMDVSGYVLVVAKGGPKLKPPGTHNLRNGTGLACGSSDTDDLANCLANRLHKPVINKTNIQGSYDFRLTMASLAEDQQLSSVLFTVLQDEFGLKLESQKVPIRMLVIDEVQRPTEN